MSLDHNAFEFDWVEFSSDLLPVLEAAIRADSGAALTEFIRRNLDTCRNPYDGRSLDDSWEESLEAGDLQELADFALTKFYDPGNSQGLGFEWMDVSARLPAPCRQALLGTALAGFDPGRQGSFFQTPAEVVQSIERLAGQSDPALASFKMLLVSARRNQRGIYTTF
jgi:hypothetical protein